MKKECEFVNFVTDALYLGPTTPVEPQCEITKGPCESYGNHAFCSTMNNIMEQNATRSAVAEDPGLIEYIAYYTRDNSIRMIQKEQEDREPGRIYKSGEYFIMRADAGETLVDFIEKLSAHIKLEHDFYNNLIDCVGEVNWSSQR